MRIRRVLAALAISGVAGATFVSTATADAPDQGDTEVHLSPAGSDDNDGSAAEPVQTLTGRSEEHTSELQSRGHLVCRLLLEKKNEQMMPTTVDPDVRM